MQRQDSDSSVEADAPTAVPLTMRPTATTADIPNDYPLPQPSVQGERSPPTKPQYAAGHVDQNHCSKSLVAMKPKLENMDVPDNDALRTTNENCQPQQLQSTTATPATISQTTIQGPTQDASQTSRGTLSQQQRITEQDACQPLDLKCADFIMGSERFHQSVSTDRNQDGRRFLSRNYHLGRRGGGRGGQPQCWQRF
jgi:hypothetical protein